MEMFRNFCCLAEISFPVSDFFGKQKDFRRNLWSCCCRAMEESQDSVILCGHQSHVSAHLTFCAGGLGRLIQDLPRMLPEEGDEPHKHLESSLIPTVLPGTVGKLIFNPLNEHLEGKPAPASCTSLFFEANKETVELCWRETHWNQKNQFLQWLQGIFPAFITKPRLIGEHWSLRKNGNKQPFHGFQNNEHSASEINNSKQLNKAGFA